MIKLPIYKHKAISNESVIDYFKNKTEEYLYTEYLSELDKFEIISGNFSAFKCISKFCTVDIMNICGYYKNIYEENDQLYGDFEVIDNVNSMLGNAIVDYYNYFPDRVYGIVKAINKDNITNIVGIWTTQYIDIGPDSPYIINNNLLYLDNIY